MERRTFIKNAALAVAAVSVAPAAISAKEPYSISSQEAGDDFVIVSDTVEDGVRTIVATPSAKVCSKQIDIKIDVENGIILDSKFTRGCPGNAIGLCRLLKNMKVEQAIETLKGTPCANKGTSCPDQFARILSSLYQA